MDQEELAKTFKLIQETFTDLQTQLDDVRNKRIRQQDFLPGVVKNRTMGEPNSYIVAGLSTDRPTTGHTATGGTLAFYDLTNKKLYIWNSINSAWDYVQFT